MRGAEVGADSGARPEWQWDVALSFAGAQRNYVEQVAEALTAQGVRCFYDADEQIELWGKYLAEELAAIYSEQAAAVVVFAFWQLARRWDTPVRLLQFLEDACKRDVLRTVGPVYQFRHSRLQDRLANPARTPARP